MKWITCVILGALAASQGACSEELEACRRHVDCTAPLALCHPQERVCYEESLDRFAPAIDWFESPFRGAACVGACLEDGPEDAVVFRRNLNTWGTSQDEQPLIFHVEGEDARSGTSTAGRYLRLRYRYDTQAPGSEAWSEEVSWSDSPDAEVIDGVRHLPVDPDLMTEALLVRRPGTAHRIQMKFLDLADRESETLSFIFYVELEMPPLTMSDCEVSDAVKGLELSRRNLGGFYSPGAEDVGVLSGRIHWSSAFQPQVSLEVERTATTRVTRARYIRKEQTDEVWDYGPLCGDVGAYHVDDANGLRRCYEGPLRQSFAYVDADGCEECADYLGRWDLEHVTSLDASDDGMAWEVRLGERYFSSAELASEDGYSLLYNQVHEWSNFQRTSTQERAVRKTYDGVVVIDELELSFERPTFSATFGEGHQVPIEYAPECASQRIVYPID